ncbi:stage II sporulation protein AB (anti-sigma F factor) [Ruminococcaceae bacterium FB2012]|nr:stage II sporulation protein AB (anti-sigma F factor) [Ruminococcaceae bacterium FB2012]
MKTKDKIINRVTLRFPSLSENERFARLAVSGFVSSLDPALDELSEIKTAVSEAVTNCIVHAYRDTVGEIRMELRLLEGCRLYISISDKGCGISDIDKAREPLFTTAPDEERAGLGFAIMESFTDKLRVRSRPGHGTAVTMLRALRTRKPADETRS